MGRFIGRKSELAALEKAYGRDCGFVVIYGRRRVGKTTLIKEFIKDKNAFYFLATEELERGNMNNFARGLARFSGQDYLAEASFESWDGFFEAFARSRPAGKKVLVIDEFTYLIGANRAFASIFQRVWDEVLKESGVMVILCGSLAGMMTRHVLSYSSPLYGRRTAQIRLAPLSFEEFRGNFKNESFEDSVMRYSVTGGVPKYMELFDDRVPLMDNIENEILSKSGFLYEEPSFLLEKEVSEAVSYFSIIKAIAAGNRKLGAIACSLGLQGPRLTAYLKTLIDLDIVEKRVPATEDNPEKSRRGLYFIKDNFIKFWFTFVAPNRSELELENTKFAMKKIRDNIVDNHTAHIFEDVSRETLERLCRKGKITFSFDRLGAFWNGGVEIDICAVNRDEKTALLGECKFTKKPVDARVYFDLVKKAESAGELAGYEKSYALFSKSGFSVELQKLKSKCRRLYLVNNGELDEN
jgi:hypothetical protein